LAGCSEDEALKRRLIQVFRSSELDRWVGNLVSRGESWEKELHYAIPPKEDLKDTVTPRERFLQVHGSVFRAGMKDAAEEKSDGRVLLVLHDITELKRLEQIRKDFVANVSHELKTPITSLKGYVETLLDGALDDRPKAEEFLRIIASQTERINAIVTDLLSLSRLEQAGSTLEKEPLPGRSLLESALGVCRRKAEEKRITFDLVCPEELFVPANTLLIEQALVNLIDNAVKYSNAGSVVRLTAKNEGKTVTFQVEDSGCGIPEKDLPRLFERFFRVDRARSRELGGTGLGLAIVKHIALAHGGSVGVSSVEGKGAVFTLRIPSAGLSGSSPAGGSVPSEL
ncbi:MAG: ATP-binding protein, partial [Spirochaetales bacterium]|nr:ATP-binding protein [Spirochaetales bacterium]